ncbi:MAG TPA: hypothetical protein VNW15_08050 [Rhizomicrobium sp.]|jgi:hypothetical protein|nr:hypothetical protein [Rhizomicrobium sp.]
MRSSLTALLLLALSVPAFAGEPAKGAPGTNVDMPYLMAPMTGADGKLSGYAYISTLLTATSDTNALAVRDKLAFVQDAFVRDVNGASIAKPGDPATVDQATLATRLLADAKRIMGAGKVASIGIVQVQIAPLHPVETPALNTPPPSPDSAAKPAGNTKKGG